MRGHDLQLAIIQCAQYIVKQANAVTRVHFNHARRSADLVIHEYRRRHADFPATRDHPPTRQFVGEIQSACTRLGDEAGNIYDYFDGKTDIAQKRITFIGDAATRIAEDGLRILRFFRFLAMLGTPPADEIALQAISEKKGMLAELSGERVANEMKKLLGAHNPAYALRMMQRTGVTALVFGREIEPSTMIRLQMLEGQADYQCSVWARGLALLPSAHHVDAEWLAHRWKLSRHEAQQLTLLAGLPAFNASAPRHVHTRILRLHGAPAYLDWLLTQAATTPGIDIAPYVHLAHDFVPMPFPITAKDLMATGMKEGKQLGEMLAQLEQRWEESDYMITKEQLLATLS